MKKDIFIDNNIASKFNNPADIHYKELIKWLLDNHEILSDKDDRAYLVVSSKLLAEYMRSCYAASGATAIPAIINQLTREGRLIKITNKQITDFKQQYFSNKVIRNLQSNKEDWDHIPVVMLSDRKYALVRDRKFTFDLNHFPKFTVLVCERPEDMPYK